MDGKRTKTAEIKPPIRFEELAAGRLRLGRITLDNPGSLNAITLEMFRALEERLLRWREREDIVCIVLEASSGRAFSAGGDVKTLALELKRDPGTAFAREFFAAEYFVDYLIHAYPKPILCWADGITMGGGLGIMNGASHRVVTERTVMAMPETALGFFPDVGATYFYNRLPDGLGLFLGLTGARFDGASAVAIGLADALAPASARRPLIEGLLRTEWTGDPPADKDTLGRRLAGAAVTDAGKSAGLTGRLDRIARLVEGKRVEEIDGAFRAWSGSDEWLGSALRGYASGSPTSVRVVFEQLKRGRNLSLREVFLREWDMAMNFCADSDFHEGVRALLIDKDRRPRWNPPLLSEVTNEIVERRLSPSAVRPHLVDAKLKRAGIG